MRMRLVLSGPMSNRPDYNFPAFDDARDRLTALGHNITSPADMDRARGWVEETNITTYGDPETVWLVTHTDRFDYEQAMAACLDEIGAADGIVLLDGWEQSPGALRELAEARRLHKQVYRLSGDHLYQMDNNTIVTHQNVPPGASVDWAELKERLATMIAEEQHEAQQAPMFTPQVDAHPMSLAFYNILTEAAAMHDRKQRDYGRTNDPFSNVRASEDFGIPGWVGCMMRANDKMRRLQKFAQTGTLNNESVEDSLLDLLVYAGIGLALYREQSK